MPVPAPRRNKQKAGREVYMCLTPTRIEGLYCAAPYCVACCEGQIATAPVLLR